MKMAERKRVLVIGGSGYLGQHLLDGLATADSETPFDLAFTHNRPIPPPELINAISPVLTFRVDVRTGEGFESISNTFGKIFATLAALGCFVEEKEAVSKAVVVEAVYWNSSPHVVVNCAALSVPRACEVDPVTTMATNLPSSLINWLSSFKDNNILLIHLSTDQVYEGLKSFYKEEDETAPVNMYGKSKVAAEQFISEQWSNFAILRSSIIYGPQTLSPVSKSLPIQWIDSSLSRSEGIEFFHDEFRCPVYVKDVVNVILALTKKWISDGNQMKLILNVGGPDRLSRAQMAVAVADYRGYDLSLIKLVSAASINRGVVSPADISMDISRLIHVLGISPISFKEGVRLTLESAS